MPTMTVNGITINYREAGEGFPIVLIHGYTGNLRNWALTVPVLTERYRTISVDLRGHGQSNKPIQREDYDFDLMADDVYQVLNQLGLTECYLVGHSMGGVVSQRLVLAHPELVRALILVDTAGGTQDIGRTEWRARVLEVARTEGMEAAFEEQLRLTDVPEVFKANPRYIDIWREQFLMTSREAFVHCGDAMADRASMLDRLISVKVPALVICGEKDAPFLEPSRRLHEAIPGSEFTIISGSGHGPPMEAPDEFNRVLTEFLAKVEQAVPAS